MIHSEVNKLRIKKTKNPLDRIAKNLSKKYKIICFDELEIIDIADAMIVYKLFSALLDRNISFIITSNFIPKDLYKNGLQRQQFIPFIKIIKNKMFILNIKNDSDLRSLKKNKKNFFYLHPLSSSSKESYLNILKKIDKSNRFRKIKITSLGRDLFFDYTLENIVLTNFKYICSYKFSPNDYISISKYFNWFFIDNIPELNKNMLNEARRFVILIDILYEKKKKLVIRADKNVENIFIFKTNKELPFLRTVSRIIEMTSKEWQTSKKWVTYNE